MGTTANRFERICAFNACAGIVHPAIFIAVETNKTQRQLVIDQRQIDHAIITLAKRIAIDKAEIDKGRRFKLVRIRGFCKNPDGTGQRVRAK